MFVKESAWVASWFVITMLFGCQSAAPPEPQQEAPPQEASQAQQTTGSQAVGESMDSVWKQQKLIRSAEMSVEVENVERATKDIEAIAARHDGLVAGVESSRDRRGNRSANLKVRVPAEQFDAVVGEVRAVGTVERESIATEDVTKAYADLETRLSVKRQAAERISNLLASRAGTLPDILEAERELSRLTGDIEGLLGEQRYYDGRIAISTIEVRLYGQTPVESDEFPPLGEALTSSFSLLVYFANTLLYLLVSLVPWLLVAIPAWWLIRAARRWRSRAGS